MTQDFDDFFLKEYERISEAYFSTMNSISEFMKHYITIASLPLALAVVFARPADLKDVVEYLRIHPYVLTIPLGLMSAAGIAMAVFVMGLRFDAILYARTINGVRSYFARSTDKSTKRFIVLPLVTSSPSFFWGPFLAVVTTLAIINTAYALAAVYIHSQLGGQPWTWIGWLIPAAIFLGHFGLYKGLALRHERVWSKRVARKTARRDSTQLQVHDPDEEE